MLRIRIGAILILFGLVAIGASWSADDDQTPAGNLDGRVWPCAVDQPHRENMAGTRPVRIIEGGEVVKELFA